MIYRVGIVVAVVLAAAGLIAAMMLPGRLLYSGSALADRAQPGTAAIPVAL
jgi:hypothetical protein